MAVGGFDGVLRCFGCGLLVFVVSGRGVVWWEATFGVEATGSLLRAGKRLVRVVVLRTRFVAPSIILGLLEG